MNIIYCCQTIDQNSKALGETLSRIISLSKNKRVNKIFVVSINKSQFTNNTKNIEFLFLDGNNKMEKLFSAISIFIKIFSKNKIHVAYCYMSNVFPYILYFFKLIYKFKILFWNCHTVKNNFTKFSIKYLVDYWLVSDNVYKIYDTKNCRNIGYSSNDNFYYDKLKNKKRPYDLITVGRVTPIKNIHTIIEAIYYVKKIYSVNLNCIIIGSPYVDYDHQYLSFIKKLISFYDLKNIRLEGFIKNSQLRKYYVKSKIFLSACPGGLGKSGIEAISSGCIPITTEENMSVYNKKFNSLLNCKNDSLVLARKINEILGLKSQNSSMIKKYLESLSSNFTYDKFNKNLLKLI